MSLADTEHMKITDKVCSLYHPMVDGAGSGYASDDYGDDEISSGLGLNPGPCAWHIFLVLFSFLFEALSLTPYVILNGFELLVLLPPQIVFIYHHT